jgi:hypothetical protein
MPEKDKDMSYIPFNFQKEPSCSLAAKLIGQRVVMETYKKLPLKDASIDYEGVIDSVGKRIVINDKPLVCDNHFYIQGKIPESVESDLYVLKKEAERLADIVVKAIKIKRQIKRFALQVVETRTTYDLLLGSNIGQYAIVYGIDTIYAQSKVKKIYSKRKRNLHG